MSSGWQFKIGDGDLTTGRDAGVLSCSISYVSRGVDTATLTCTLDVVIPYGTLVEVWHGDVRRFLGRAAPGRRTVSGGERVVVYRIDGPWWWLTRVPYRQSWNVLLYDELGAITMSRVILNQGADGDPITAEEQLEEIVAWATEADAPLQFGSADVALTLPFDEQRDLLCSQAIERLLRFTPDVCAWIDYAGDPVPVVHFGRGAACTVPANAEVLVDQRRDDLVVPGVEIQIERLGTVDGDQFRRVETLLAGDTNDVDAVHATLQLAGAESSRTMMRLEVITEDIPDPLDDAAWWIARHPRLAGIAAADLSFIQTARWERDDEAEPPAWVLATDPTDYPRIAITPMADLTALDLSSRVERFTATVDIIMRDGDEEIVDQEHGVELEIELVTTSASTREYSHTAALSSESGESVPGDLAVQLLEHWSRLFYDGSAAWPLSAGWPVVGTLVSGSPVQTATVESVRNTAEVSFGAPSHLSVTDFAALLQGFRTRRPSISWQSRQTGTPPAESDVQQGLKAPNRAAGFAPGQKRRQKVVAEEADGSHAIDVNPASVSGPESAVTIQPRELILHEGAALRRRQVMASEAYGTDPAIPDKAQYDLYQLDESGKPVWGVGKMIVS
jgi:hypothetical protein